MACLMKLASDVRESRLGSQNPIRHVLAGSSLRWQRTWPPAGTPIACSRLLIARAALVSRRLNASTLLLTDWTASALPQDHQSS